MRRLFWSSLFLIIALVPVASALSQATPPPNVRITNDPALQNEQQLWVDPADASVVVATWQDQSTGSPQVAIGRSTDGGQTWSHSLFPAGLHYYNDSSLQRHPSLTYDGAGTLFLTLEEEIADSLSAVLSYRSVDQGQSWSAPVLLAAVLDSSSLNHPAAIIDTTGGPNDGTVYLAWNFTSAGAWYGSRDVRLSRSTDGGATFTPDLVLAPNQLDPDCDPAAYVPAYLDWRDFPNMAVHPNGTLHAFWGGVSFDTGDGCHMWRTLKHRRSTDGGLTFSPAQTLFPGTFDFQPSSAVDYGSGPFSGNLYVVGEQGANDNIGVSFVRSTDNGTSWAEPLIVNETVGRHYQPSIAINDEGVIATLFASAPPDSEVYDIYAAYSYDGGASFTKNHRISDVSSSPTWIFGESFGVHFGLALTGERVNAMWTDYRDGNFETYSAAWDVPLVEPRVFAPDSGDYLYTDAPTFEWATSWKQNQDRYRIEIADDSAFTMITETRIVDTSIYTLDGSLPDAEHFWRVKTFNTAETDSSDYSEVRSFIVEAAPPSQVFLESPIGSRTRGPITFDWTPQVEYGPGEVTYDLHVYPEPPGSGYPDTIVTGLTDSQYSFDTTYGDSIRWYVIATATAGGAQVVSDTGSYNFYGCCEGETGDANADGAINLTDLNLAVASLFGGFGTLPPCPAALNTDGDSSCALTLTDLTLLVNRLFFTFVPTAPCNVFDQSNCPPPGW